MIEGGHRIRPRWAEVGTEVVTCHTHRELGTTELGQDRDLAGEVFFSSGIPKEKACNCALSSWGYILQS